MRASCLKEPGPKMNPPCRYSDSRRRRFIDLLNDTDQYWVEVMGDQLLHDLNYYDLFTRMWLRSNKGRDGLGGANALSASNVGSGPMETFRKSELYQLMPNVSQRTAIKYIQIAIDNGLLIERADPCDLRSRHITMSADLKRKIEAFLDYSISVFDTFPPATSQMEIEPRTDEIEHDARRD
jgi:hypothetical protein